MGTRTFFEQLKTLRNRFVAKDLATMIAQDETKLLEELRRRNLKRRGYSKVFVIGANKTGTTTVEDVLRSLKFKLPRQTRQEQLLSHVLVSGRYDILRRFVSKYDAFQDLPFSQESLYVALDCMFPASKFILTVRDPEAWFKSLTRFYAKAYGIRDGKADRAHFEDREIYLHKNYTFEQARRHVSFVENNAVVEKWDRLYDQDTRTAAFLRRNSEITRYFRNRPNDLLVFDVSKETDTSKICAFLERDPSNIRPLPHLNATDQA